MINLTLLSTILVPVLVYLLSRKPDDRNDVLRDYRVPPDTEVRSCPTHWGVPAATMRLDKALLREITCHPDYVEHNVPEAWYKWSPADARRRARLKVAQEQARGVLSIRQQAS